MLETSMSYILQIITIANFIGDQYEKLVKQATCIGKKNAKMCWETIKRFWFVKCYVSVPMNSYLVSNITKPHES